MTRAYRNLGEFINTLAQAGELTRIAEPMDPVLGISRRTDEESKRPGGGKALLFTNVTGSVFPVATNLFGSMRRICMALGVQKLDDLADRIREYIDFHPPQGLREALNVIPMAIDVTRFFPRTVKTAPCQEVVLTGDQVDLGALPVLQCWPQDAGRFVTLPLVFTQSLTTGKRNVGMYRLQIYDKKTTGMHWHIHKDGSHYYSEYAAADKRMPVAVAIGADPATVYAATAPMPRGVDEMLLAGFIRKKPVPMVQCKTIDMKVPAEAEFVLEGYVQPGELRREGPFGDHTGYYSLADDYPVFHVTAITHRKQPVYNATLVGPPPMEDCYLAKATERLFLPMLQSVLPEITDYWFPWEGVFHNIVIAAIDKAYPGHAQKVMSGLWGSGQMSFCKGIVLVDGNVDPQDPPAVMAQLASRFDPATDITLATGVLDVLDHSAPRANFGSKIGIDLTTRWPGEPERAPAPADAPEDTDAVAESLVAALPEITGCRILAIGASGHTIAAVGVDKSKRKGKKSLVDRVAAVLPGTGITLAGLFDASVDLTDQSFLLWKLFNNTDPGRDLRAADGRMVVDATRKGTADGHTREWPDELTFDVD